MALKVKAVEKKIKFDKNPNNPSVLRYVMSPELCTRLVNHLLQPKSRSIVEKCDFSHIFLR